MSTQQSDGTGLVFWDPYLNPYKDALKHRYNKFREYLQSIEQHQSLDEFTKGYEFFGFNRTDGGIVYREWAPGAQEAFLIGDFNGWNRESHPMKRDEFGIHSIFLPDVDGKPAIPHNSKVKVCLKISDGSKVDRVPAWMTYVTQEPDNSYVGRIWMPEQPYKQRVPRPAIPEALRIYEAHVGMASSEGKVASYTEFERDVLPYVVDAGYNAVQLMAIMEHAYYASFGYHVTNYFAPSSRFGTPDELRSLIDRAHELGLVVLIDVVHSHASKNVLDGINRFDGTDHQYFHEGARGYHDLWDSRLFNYGHWEVQRFLLSNLRYWIECFGFDGFRFDGVTSMLYLHHGLGTAFTSYDDYFGPAVDVEAVAYLMLANHMLRRLYPSSSSPSSSPSSSSGVVTVAEEVSGMPGLCRPVSEGGLGFGLRLAMAVPDMWIKLLKEQRDETWEMGHIVHTLTNRRYREPSVAYAESHDQALVGDKTLAFWLMDREMYDNMSTLSPLTPVIDRGLALHKMIRLITLSLGGEGYLCFMGNEFGHPEWIDFPREGNGNSYHYCRRQWNLLHDDMLRYKFLAAFDKAMMRLDKECRILPSDHTYISLKHEQDKIIAFDRSDGLVFVFNFHPTQSFTDYRIGTPWSGSYRVVLCSDDAAFGGHSRIDPDTVYPTQQGPWCDRDHFFLAYVPCRTALVFRRQ